VICGRRYFRVSSERQTAKNQFEDQLRVAEKDGSSRDWNGIRAALTACVVKQRRPTSAGSNRTIYRVQPEVAEELARECI
jgi:hypothetical protein